MKTIWYWHILIFGIIINLFAFISNSRYFVLSNIWVIFSTPILLFCLYKFFSKKKADLQEKK